MVDSKAAQDREIVQVLLALEMLSHGATQAWNASGGHSGEPDDRMVSLVVRYENPPHVRWRIVYERQATFAGREAVITDAKAELNQWRGTGERPKVEGKSLVDLILEDGEGWEPEVVAQRYGVDAAFVRRKRMAAGRGLEDGRKILKDDEPELVDRPGKAAELRRQGLSTRQIAEVLGCHQTQVMRWVRKSAD